MVLNFQVSFFWEKVPGENCKWHVCWNTLSSIFPKLDQVKILAFHFIFYVVITLVFIKTFPNYCLWHFFRLEREAGLEYMEIQNLLEFYDDNRWDLGVSYNFSLKFLLLWFLHYTLLYQSTVFWDASRSRSWSCGPQREALTKILWCTRFCVGFIVLSSYKLYKVQHSIAWDKILQKCLI